MSALKTVLMAGILVCAVGCGAKDVTTTAIPTSSATTTVTATRGETPSAQSAAEIIRVAVPEVSRLIPITEDNDANNMIGRVNGYVAATVSCRFADRWGL